MEKDERLIIKDCCRLRVLLRASLMNCLQVGASERKQLTAAMDDYKKLPSLSATRNPITNAQVNHAHHSLISVE